ncbi:UNVERIFIED_CONTAM: hypothetical protein GTU68_057576 [Idotea baltica]|nr:hypothetical protein [Idotea baltica]
MPYNFEWTVLDSPSGNNFGHAENSDGNNVQGQYYVYLPDGRLQTVTYTANDQTGFVADVRYEGEAQFPTSSGGGGGGGFIGGVIGGGATGGGYN